MVFLCHLSLLIYKPSQSNLKSTQEDAAKVGPGHFCGILIIQIVEWRNLDTLFNLIILVRRNLRKLSKLVLQSARGIDVESTIRMLNAFHCISPLGFGW